ncbi:MAG: hypothetical protein U5Q16_09885 [Gammaproteobacteria bacterium]|nr:hypothetical protein [Gammaproteobacteria bacterium]
MGDSAPASIRISRELYVPQSLVLEVWIEPAHLACWYVPPEGEESSVHGREDGFRAVWRDASAGLATEVFERTAPPAAGALAGTLHLSIPGRGSCDSRLHVELADLGGGCRIELSQEAFPEGAWRDWYDDAWAHRLARLEGYFSSI